MNNLKMSTISRNLKKYKTKYSLLIALVLIVSLITYYRVKIQMDLGPGWDTYDFLSNALIFAGKDMGYSDLDRPPLISFITSIFFRIGYVSEATIFAVDGALSIFGVIGLYLLLSYRFNSVLSFLGSLLYATFPIVLNFVGFGLTDVPSVSFSIWTLYFTVLAVKRDSKYFYLIFPFIMLAFLTRYNSALLIFPVLFYLLINKNSLKNVKEILIGILGSFLLIIPVFILFQLEFGNFLYPFLDSLNITGSTFSPQSYSYYPESSYFITGMPLFIGEEIYNILKIILIILSGIIIYNLIKATSAVKRVSFNSLKSQKFKIIKLTIFLVLSVIFIGTFGNITYIRSLLIFFILLYVFYELLKGLKRKHLGMDLLIFSFFMTFFIFHSVFVIKVDRYFVFMAPAVSYFLIWGLNEILNTLRIKTQNKNIISSIIAIALIVIVLSSTPSHLDKIQKENEGMKFLNEKAELASEWLKNYDPNYKDKIIYSDIWTYFGWFLKTDIKKMPTFKDNQTYYLGVKDRTFTYEDNMAFNWELEVNNADYYLCTMPELNITSYTPVKRIEDLTIYEKIR